MYQMHSFGTFRIWRGRDGENEKEGEKMRGRWEDMREGWKRSKPNEDVGTSYEYGVH